MRPSGTELKALKAVEELVTADHIAVSHKTGASTGYTDYLLRDLAKYNYVERVGKAYRLTPQGKDILEEKRKIQEELQRFQVGIEEWLEEGLGRMIITQIIENRLRIRAMVELIAQKDILGQEELREHLAEVAQRDWNEEVDRLLPVGLAEGFKILPEEEAEGSLGWMIITQAIENKLKIRAIVELIAQKGILNQEELNHHLATVVQRDWNQEVDRLLPEELVEEVPKTLEREAVPIGNVGSHPIGVDSHSRPFKVGEVPATDSLSRSFQEVRAALKIQLQEQRKYIRSI